MNNSGNAQTPADLLERVRQAAETLNVEQTLNAEQALNGGIPFEAGTLMVIPDTSDSGIEWTLLARADERVLVVPVDEAPYNGDGDLKGEILEDEILEAGGAPLWLRCRWSRWIPAGVLDDAQRSGALTPETVAEARTRVESDDGGRSIVEPGSGSPGYRAWIEDAVLPACACLDDLARAAQPDRRARVPASVLRMPSTRESTVVQQPAVSTWRRMAPLAALLLLALSIMLLNWGLFERGRAERTLVALRSLENQRVVERSEPEPGVDVGVSYVFLHPSGSLRGEESELSLDGGSSVLLVALMPSGLEAGAMRLELLRVGVDDPVWTGEGAVASNGELRLVVPSRLLPVGKYRLRSRSRDAADAGEPWIEHRFSVVAESSD